MSASIRFRVTQTTSYQYLSTELLNYLNNEVASFKGLILSSLLVVPDSNPGTCSQAFKNEGEILSTTLKLLTDSSLQRSAMKAWDPVFAIRLKKTVLDVRTKRRPSGRIFSGIRTGRRCSGPEVAVTDDRIGSRGTMTQLMTLVFESVTGTWEKFFSKRLIFTRLGFYPSFTANHRSTALL